MVKSYTRYEPVKNFGVINSPNSNIVWVPDNNNNSGGGKVFTAGLEHVLQWDLKKNELISKWQDGELASCVCQLTYEKNTGLVAAGYENGSIRIWDSTSGELMITFNGHKSAVSSLKFDPMGTRLVSGSKDSDLIVWDLVGEVGLYRLRGHRDQVTDLEFLEENIVISCGKEGLVKVWDLDTQHCVETHVSHRGECWGLAVDEDNGTIMTVGNDKEIKVWKYESENKLGEQLIIQGTLEKSSNDRAVDIKFINNNGFFGIANADKNIEIFKVRSSEEVKKSVSRKHKRAKEKGNESNVNESDVNERFVQYTVVRTPAKVCSFDWCDVNKKKELIFVCSLNNNSVHTFSVATSGKHNQLADYQRVYGIEQQGHRTDVRALALSSDNKLVASASNGLLNVWNIITGNCLRTFKCGYAVCAAFLPGDALIVVGTKEGKLELFDLASAQLMEEIDAHPDGELWSLHLHISSEGTTMVTAGGKDKSVKFWEFKVSQEQVPGTLRTVSRMKLKHKKTLELDEDVLSVRLSPDNKYIAASLMNYTVKVFFVDTLKFYLNLYGHKLPVLSMDISYDCKQIITCSADKNVKIWGLDFGDCHKSIFAHDDSIMNVQYEPKSHNFFSVGKDSLVKYWDGDKFVLIQQLKPGHHSQVWALAVGDGVVVSASHDKSMRVWRQFDDPLFIEEERELEREEEYEETLLEESNQEANENNNEDEEDRARAGKQTMVSLKSGERLMEALEIGTEDLERESIPKPHRPPRHVILQHMNLSAAQYVMQVLSKIKPAQLEDALLVLPFDRVKELMNFIQLWTQDPVYHNVAPLICKVLFFLLRVHHKQLVAAASHTGEQVREIIESVRENLRTQLNQHRDTLGYNMAALSTIKTEWRQNHEHEFVDEREYAVEQERQAKKRVFTTV